LDRPVEPGDDGKKKGAPRKERALMKI
jgi:hypothetical protein